MTGPTSDPLVSFDKVFKGYPLKAQSDEKPVFARRMANADARLHFALRGVSFAVHRGERVALVGRNGAGKSTALRLINGAVAPTAGMIAVRGRVSALLELGLGFHEDMSGYDNIRGALAYNALQPSEIREAIEDVIDFCELGAFLDYPIKIYSAGMRMRLFFAVATAIRPDILIVDEALGAGDAYFGQRSLERMRRLTDRGGALILVSHNLGQVADICERGIWIEGGEIVADGPAMSIMNLYTTFAADLQERAAAQVDAAARLTPEPIDAWLMQRLDKMHAAQGVPPIVVTALPGRLTADVAGRDGSSVRRFTAGDCFVCNIEVSRRAQADTVATVSLLVYIFTADGRLVTEALCDEALGITDDGPVVVRASLSALPLGPGEYHVTGVAVDNSGRPWAVFERSIRITVLNSDLTETSLVLQSGHWGIRLQDASGNGETG